MPTIDASFGTGIDQRTRPEYVDPAAAWLNTENARVEKTGGISKRFGFSAGVLTRIDGTTRSAGHRLCADGTVTTVLDASSIDSQSLAASVSVNHGRVPEATYRQIGLPMMGKDGSLSDVEYCNGYFAITCTSTVGTTSYASVTIVDATTFAVVHGPYLLGAATNALLAHYSTYFVVAKVDTATTTIALVYLNTSTATTINSGWSSIGTVTSAWTGNGVSLCSLSNRIAIAYGLGSGTDRLAVSTYNISGVIDSAAVGTSSTTPASCDIAIGPNADTLWVTWSEGAAVNVIAFLPTDLTTVLGTTFNAITATGTTAHPKICAHGTTSSKARVFATDSTSSSTAGSIMRGVTIAAGAVVADGSAYALPGLVHMSRPFAYGSRYYILATAGNDFPNVSTTVLISACVVDWTENTTWVRPVALVDILAVLNATWPFQNGKIVASSTSTMRYAPMNTRRSALGNAAELIELDFASTNRWQAVAYGNSMYLSGGVLGYMDGRTFTEAGFIHRPVRPSASTSGTGVTFSTGVRYVAVFEAIDADGNLSISGVSDPSSLVTCTNKTVTVSTLPCVVTYRNDSNGAALGSMRVVFYRTADNGGTPPYYRLAAVDNNTSSSTASYNDTTSSVEANAKLYLQPGVNGTALDRRAPPGCPHIVVYNGMLVGARGSDVWHSGQSVIGETPWFNPVFQIPVDGNGEITGLAAQDGTLYVFKRGGVWALTGEQPSDNGASGGLGAPRRLAVDVGCIEQRSIVVTSLGIFFQSERGIELLSRAQAVEWIGEPIQDEVNSRPYIMAATLDPGEVLVYFELASSVSSGLASGTGRTLVYDLSLKKWVSIDRRFNAAFDADAPAQSACMVYNGSAWRYAWLDASGYVYTEDQSSYLDLGSTWVTLRAESAWAKAAGVQGLQQFDRAILMGKYATDSNVKIYLAYDYNTTYQSAQTFTRATIAAITTGTGGVGTLPNLHLQHAGHDDAGACMSVRVKIEDTPPTGGSVGTGKGSTWNTLTFVGRATSADGYLLPDGAG